MKLNFFARVYRTIFGSLFLIIPFISLQASEAILTDWLVRLGDSIEAQGEANEFHLGAVSGADDSFYISNVSYGISKRSLQTGEVIWSNSLHQNISQSSLAISEEGIFGGDTKGNIFKINPATGEELWSVNSKGVVFGRPLVAESKVYVLNSYGVLQAYDAMTGDWQWQQEDSGGASLGLWSFQGPIFQNARVLAGFPSGVLQAFEPATGNRLWSEPFQLAAAETMGLNDLKAVSAEGDYLAASSFSGDLVLWGVSKGSLSLKWKKKLSLHTPPTFDFETNTLYVSDREGFVYALDLKTGYERWQYKAPDGLATSLRFAENNIWLASSGGSIIVLSKDGTEISKTKPVAAPIYAPAFVLNDRAAIFVDSRGFLRRMSLVENRSEDKPSLTAFKDIFSKIF